MRSISEQSQTKNNDALINRMSEKIRDVLNSVAVSDSVKIVSICVEAENLDPLRWLSSQNIYPSVYWSDRLSQFETAGVGIAVKSNSLDELKINDCDNSVRFFGGFRFNSDSDISENWIKFGQAQLVLPRFEITKSDSGTEFICNLKFPDDLKNIDIIENQLNSLRFDDNGNKISLPKLLNRTDNPDKDEWESNIKKILGLIENGKIEKLVSARESVLVFSEDLNPFSTLERLKNSTPGCFHFCFRPDNESAFIGASPERLYHRKKKQIISEALAGTRARGKTAEDDSNLGRELFNSEKDIREHDFVSKSIIKNLNRFCRKIKISEETTLMKLARVQHLMTGIEGEMKDKVNDREILKSLHPTPAVGGYPQEKSVDLITEIEPFDRGWYTGPVGWISNDEADFAVAIRSGLIVKNKLHVYAGAGIVEGSDPDNEWNEVESKIATFMRVLS